MDLIQSICILSICAIAVYLDLQFGKIPNIVIITGLCLGMGYQILSKGIPGFLLYWGGVGIPLILLGGLYYFRMLGAGDIKLFCVLGGFLNIVSIFYCIFIAFLIGAGISVLLMIRRRNLWTRLYYFSEYISSFIKTRQWKPYRTDMDKDSHIHFTIPICLSVILHVGGFY